MAARRRGRSLGGQPGYGGVSEGNVGEQGPKPPEPRGVRGDEARRKRPPPVDERELPKIGPRPRKVA